MATSPKSAQASLEASPSVTDSEPASVSAPASFEEALAELETIVQGMEGGRQTLEASLAAYQRGAVLLKFCQDTLAAAEQKIEVLEGGMLRDFKSQDESQT